MLNVDYDIEHTAEYMWINSHQVKATCNCGAFTTMHAERTEPVVDVETRLINGMHPGCRWTVNSTSFTSTVFVKCD